MSWFCLGKVIDWKHFCETFGKSFHESQGRPGLPTRLMVGLTYLKYLHNLSDEKTIKQFLQSPYWQYFCGFICFQKEAPLEASSLTRFRERLGEQGARGAIEANNRSGKEGRSFKEVSFKESDSGYDSTGKKHQLSDRRKVNQQGKGEAFEGGKKGESFHCVRVTSLKGRGKALSLPVIFMQSSTREAKASVRKQKTWLGRVIRDIKRKCSEPPGTMQKALELGQSVFEQERHSKGKIYSLHEPQVECLSKGKAHKRYEFGNKVSFTVTAAGNWLIGAKSFFGNPFDGKTLN